jgi:dehydrogenase/reductase SDR family member 1
MQEPTRARVAIVTGASRGIGRGIALGLGEAGFTVYLTSRTVADGDSERPGSVTKTAAEVTGLGGLGIAVRCDHRSDAETEAVFTRVQAEQGRLDLLVNNATSYTTDLGPREDAPFWELPIDDWDQMHAVGLRSHYVASRCAARLMVPEHRGLIVNVSSAGAIQYTGNVSYNVVKAGVDMLTLASAEELRPYGVAVVSIWPRLTRTEGFLAHLELFPDAAKAWSPQLSGRAVAALAADPGVFDKSGRAFDIGVLAEEYGFTDLDGDPHARSGLGSGFRAERPSRVGLRDPAGRADPMRRSASRPSSSDPRARERPR